MPITSPTRALVAPGWTMDPVAEALRLVDVGKVYGGDGDDGPRVVALHSLDLRIVAGTFTAVMGPSGSGKSTFLQCAAGLEPVTSGRIALAGTEITALDETATVRFRRDHVGFVFQHYNLLPTLTVGQNIVLPARLARRRVDRGLVQATTGRLGLGDRLDHLPSELSGGQQQRVAIARAIVTRPAVVFADEPTGALDSTNARVVLDCLRAAVRDHGLTVVMVTHDPVAAAQADRVLFLADGRLAGELQDPTAEVVAERLAGLSPLASDGALLASAGR